MQHFHSLLTRILQILPQAAQHGEPASTVCLHSNVGRPVSLPW